MALAAIKGNQTANEIASEFGIHVSLVNRWKKEAIEALPLVFGDTQAKQSKKMRLSGSAFIRRLASFGSNWTG